MPTAHQENGFDFRFYSNDHPPMHVHTVHGGTVCVFFLDEIEERVDEDGIAYVAVVRACLPKALRPFVLWSRVCKT